MTYQRTTKIEKIANRDGGVLRVGDLVEHYWAAYSASRYFSGEIVDIARHRVAILDGEEVFWVFANQVRESEVVLRAREA